MESRQVKNIADAKTYVEKKGASHVKVGVYDIDGVLRGKYMSKDKFFSALDNNFGFCDVVLGWDLKDQLYDNVKFTGWHTGYPDAPTRIIPESCRDLPFEENGVFFLCEFAEDAASICPRGMLKKVLARASEQGLLFYSGFEYEFFVFNETPDSIRDKNYQNLQPMAPGEFGYSVIRNSVGSETYQAILSLAERMDFPLEGLHEETGPGVLEAAIGYDEALTAADKASLFKTFTKVDAQRRGQLATFMAKWSPEYPGQSGHIHISARDEQGKAIFFDDTQSGNMSATMRHFLAGQQKLMPELLAMIAPTINSYRRLIPGFWAPTEASIGIENRTCSLRVIPGSAKSQRMEFRVAASDANPYLVLAAALGSGLLGIENRWEPEPFVEGNAYQQDFPDHLKLPATLWDAAQRYKESSAAKELFGEAFVEHFAASREWEEREFRKHISDWELARYFEII
ncbi:MAG: glutamine synthetase [Pseudomonadales bacterium]|nr:glutamine synthetase [Pseudomonadales bacterium]